MPRPSRPIVVAVAIAAVVIGAPIAWYLGSPVFLRTELHEPAIEALEPPAATSTPAPTPTAAALTDGPAASTAVPSPAASAIAAEPAWTPDPPRTGRFSGTDDFHFGRGTAILREVEAGRWVVRLEDFAVRNGPDLYVVLSPDPGGYTDDAIEVGRLKATDGNFNMRVPDGTDVSEVRSVLIWCKQFSHLFAVAPLEG
ncbi:MAG TPA: DM13 domain-containing protein [Candidatus Limnocylindrales bacterium]